MEKWPFSLMFFNHISVFSLDQLLVSAGDQQRLQSVLSSVGSKSTVLTLIQEARAQSEVSEPGQARVRQRRGRVARWGPPAPQEPRIALPCPSVQASAAGSDFPLTCGLLLKLHPVLKFRGQICAAAVFFPHW